MTFPIEKILLFHSSNSPPVSRTSGKPIVIKRTRGNPLYYRPHPLGIHSEMTLRNNITPWGDMRTSTSNGSRCGSKGIKMCMSSWICSIACTQIWVLNIRRKIWCSSTTSLSTDTFRRKWSFLKSPLLVQHTGMMPRLSKKSNKRSNNLDLWIKNKGKVPPNCIIKDKSKVRQPRTTC